MNLTRRRNQRWRWTHLARKWLLRKIRSRKIRQTKQSLWRLNNKKTRSLWKKRTRTGIMTKKTITLLIRIKVWQKKILIVNKVTTKMLILITRMVKITEVSMSPKQNWKSLKLKVRRILQKKWTMTNRQNHPKTRKSQPRKRSPTTEQRSHQRQLKRARRNQKNLIWTTMATNLQMKPTRLKRK